ncbi:MAG: hypothetical protein ACK4SX_11720 [Alcanivoracaceae bacterium]
MPVAGPFIATPLQDHIPGELDALVQRTSGKITDRDKKLGIGLLIDAYCDVVDHTLIGLLDEIGRTHDSAQLSHARRVADDVKDKARHYVGWAGGLIASHRLPPVIHHFNGLVHEIDLGNGDRSHAILPVSAPLASRADQVLVTLRDGSAKDLQEGIRLLTTIVDELMIPLAIEPKNLLDFNFLVSKPLDGAIGLVRTLIHRMLMRFGDQLTPELYPVVALHLEKFLILEHRKSAA